MGSMPRREPLLQKAWTGFACLLESTGDEGSVLQASGPMVAMVRQQAEHTEHTEVMRQESHAALEGVCHTLGSNPTPTPTPTPNPYVCHTLGSNPRQQTPARPASHAPEPRLGQAARAAEAKAVLVAEAAEAAAKQADAETRAEAAAREAQISARAAEEERGAKEVLT